MAPSTRCKTLPFHLTIPVGLHQRDGVDQAKVTELRNYIRSVMRRIKKTPHNVRPDMQYIIRLLGDIVFGEDALDDVQFSWERTLIEEENAVGVTRIEYNTDMSIEVSIALHPDPEQEFEDQNNPLDCLTQKGFIDLLNTAAHECIHAFLYRRCCSNKLCTTKGFRRCRKIWVRQVGSCGHGPAWQIFAKRSEDKINELGLWKCDLERKQEARGYLKRLGVLNDNVRALCWPEGFKG